MRNPNPSSILPPLPDKGGVGGGLRPIIPVSLIGILLLGAGMFAYLHRSAIRDWIDVRSHPPLPVEETYAEIAGERGNGARVASSTDIRLTGDRDGREAESATSSDVNEESATSSDVLETLPEKMLLAVPFTSQAPKQEWDALHEEACEEASMVMIRGYYDGERGVIASSTAEKRITALVDFETDLGYGPDVTAAEAARTIAKRWVDLRADVVPMTGATSVKRYIAEGIPVILPADGKTLPNPNFRNGGPVYHMLVVRGYDDAGFITNDPGTRKGENFRYTESGLLDAVHDWNGGSVATGTPLMIVVRPR